MFEPPRPGRRSPLTSYQRGIMRHLAKGNYFVADCFSARLEPIGVEVPRHTVRALVRASLVDDPCPLLNANTGRLTKHGRAWAHREFGAQA
jgi:hypothetical protein